MTVASEFAEAFKAVTKELAAEKKRRQRDARRSTPPRVSLARVTLKEAVFAVMRAAIAHASGDQNS